MKTRNVSLKSFALAASAVAAVVAATPAAATVNSNASDITINLTALGLVGVTVGPLTSASASWDGGPTKTDSDTLANGTLSASLAATGVSVTTGLLTDSAAAGKLNGGLNSTAKSEIDGLALSLSAAGLNVLTLGGAGNVITSMSTAHTFPSGVQTAMGVSTIANLGLVAGLTHLTINVNASTPKNDVLLNILGIEVIANRQVEVDHSAPGIESIETDALYIDIDPLGIGAVDGSVVIGESFAEVPEPAAWAEMLVGLGAVGGFMRSRRRRGVAASA